VTSGSERGEEHKMNILATRTTEENITYDILRVEKGYRIRVKDEDSGLYVQFMKTYSTLEAAKIEFAKYK
jgi:hypothetical protein